MKPLTKEDTWFAQSLSRKTCVEGLTPKAVFIEDVKSAVEMLKKDIFLELEVSKEIKKALIIIDECFPVFQEQLEKEGK